MGERERVCEWGRSLVPQCSKCNQAAGAPVELKPLPLTAQCSATWSTSRKPAFHNRKPSRKPPQTEERVGREAGFLFQVLGGRWKAMLESKPCPSWGVFYLSECREHRLALCLKGAP
ncbi:hypothetical protein Cadr_000030652 [Camelus dromedarius]|uniref:Uncharacterized protein n=1 Tax=Camelus dromedarius TaxID=9838 RepID=A0A5N4C4H1_CAMDR|nr:hypothetical protein Cadr_000030652 [Camelus dromedarius]